MVQQVNPYEASSKAVPTQIADTEQTEIASLRKTSILFAVLIIGPGVYSTLLIFERWNYNLQKGLYMELARPFFLELIQFGIPGLLAIFSYINATHEKQKTAKSFLLLSLVIFVTSTTWIAWQGISFKCSL